MSSEYPVLISTIDKLIFEEKYDEAMMLIQNHLKNGNDFSTNEDILVLGKIAGFLIDIGDRGKKQEAVERGLLIFSDKEKIFLEFFDKSSLLYSIANGKSVLFAFQRRQGLKLKPETIGLLLEAKKTFWQAHKEVNSEGSDTEFRSQLFVNLANTLNVCGRVVEALQYYDRALELSPNLPEAHASRAQALIFLNQLANGYTPNLIYQASQNFIKASELDSDIPLATRERWNKQGASLLSSLEKDGYNAEHDFSETESEALSHNPYWQYCLKNKLTLSEHAIYCSCLGARRDDLSIPPTSNGVGGDFILPMEQTLNRLKSEFHTSRLLYYQATNPEATWDLQGYEKQMARTVLNDGELFSTNVELLRISFRTCFSILDKIAIAICRIYKLATPKDKITFDRFWKASDQKKSVREERWQKINEIDNLSLLALYTQATDLDSKDGEWSNLKRWRNALEHDLLVIVGSETDIQTKRELSQNPTLYLLYDDFVEGLLQLLHFVRSAIFNFAFCVRKEGIENANQESNSTIAVITLEKERESVE